MDSNIALAIALFMAFMWALECERSRFYKQAAEREIKTSARYFALPNPED